MATSFNVIHAAAQAVLHQINNVSFYYHISATNMTDINCSYLPLTLPIRLTKEQIEWILYTDCFGQINLPRVALMDISAVKVSCM